jgi:hypothetical protein
MGEGKNRGSFIRKPPRLIPPENPMPLTIRSASAADEAALVALRRASMQLLVRETSRKVIALDVPLGFEVMPRVMMGTSL